MITTSSRSSAGSLHDWQQQFGRASRRSGHPTIRPFAIVSYLVRRQPRRWPLVDLRDVTLVALFDEPLASGRLATRLVGVGGRMTASGLEFGGPELCRFDKDLCLRPVPGGRGACFDPTRRPLLALALQLNRYLERCARYPSYPRRDTPCLPVHVSQKAQCDSSLVDFSRVRQRQVITFATGGGLRGQRADCAYDFHTTRFRQDCSWRER